MSGAAARRDIVRLARRDVRSSRAGRFLARRSRQAGWTFAQLCTAPRWPVLEEKDRIRVGAVALLLSGRSALAQEIDGHRLRAYAALVGYPVLERMLAEDGEGRGPLPSAIGLEDAARHLIMQGDAGSHARLGAAERFLKEAQAWPST